MSTAVASELDDQHLERARQLEVARELVRLIAEVEERAAEVLRRRGPMASDLELRVADLMVVIAGMRELALTFQDAVVDAHR